MAKQYTFPTLFDEALQISITKLKEWAYFQGNSIKTGTLVWSTNGRTTGRISILVNMFQDEPYVELSYHYNEEPRRYKVALVSVPSNIGKGKIWYFLCPSTQKRCRKLYSIDGYFLHREAFNGCMYQSQTRSKHSRAIDKKFGAIYNYEKLQAELDSKYFKSFYDGKPTKRFKRIMLELRKISSIDSREYLYAVLK